MAVFDSLGKGAISRRWGVLAAGLLSLTLYGCGGGSSTTPPVEPPVEPPVVIDVAAVIAANAANAANDSSTNMASAFSGLNGTGLAKVTINSKPVVNFTVFSDGKVVKGMTSATLLLSKLVPGANGSPDKWVNYIWGDDAGTWGKVDGVWVDGNFVGTPVITDQTKARTAGSDSGGTLVENAAGYYTYTFGTDITDATRASAKDSSGNAVIYEPGRTHRLSLQLSYDNAAGERVRVNPYYDFTIGADGKSVDAVNPKQVADIRSCNSCHEKLELHGGSRNDVTICVQCHQPGSIDKGTGETIDLMHLVHKIHAGNVLADANLPYYFYRFRGIERFYDFSHVGFPQDVRNCTKCHNGDASTDSKVGVKTAQGNNWFNKPNRAACGSCHAGINFATSTGTTLSGEPNVHTSGTFPLSDDSACVLCHGSDKGLAVKLAHRTNFVTPNNPEVPEGVEAFTIDLKSVALTAERNPVFEFKVLKKDGSAVVFNTYTAGATAMITGFTGNGPSMYTAFAVPQDGIADPADFNTGTSPPSQSLINVWNGTRGTLTGPDSAGYYKATVLQTGTSTPADLVIPTNAKMITGGMQSGFTQTSTGVNIVPKFVQKTASVSGNVARRAIVSNDKCEACHDRIGTSPSFHGSARTDATACSFCHNGNRNSSGWSAASTNFFHAIHAGSIRSVKFTRNASSATDGFFNIVYPGNIQNCSGCHLDNTVNFGTSASAAAATRLPLRTEATGAVPTTNTHRTSPYAWTTGSENYGVAPSYARDVVTNLGSLTTDDANLVSSPITAACAACHDSSLAISHMKAQGGSFYATRAEAKAKQPEACLLCHGAGKIADVKVMHGQ